MQKLLDIFFLYLAFIFIHRDGKSNFLSFYFTLYYFLLGI